MDFSSFSYFNPRLREGGDNSTRLSINSCFVFQSTPPRRRRQFDSKREMHRYLISIHASEKEATLIPHRGELCEGFQSTPPRRRRRLFPRPGHQNSGISIHASEKEATYDSTNILAKEQFQSTPPRRRRLFRIICHRL